MAKQYEVNYTKRYKKNRSKLSDSDKIKLDSVVKRLSNDEILEPKYKDHKLKGDLADFRECHIKPDLLLIYKKNDQELILFCINVGSHSELF